MLALGMTCEGFLTDVFMGTGRCPLGRMQMLSVDLVGGGAKRAVNRSLTFRPGTQPNALHW